MTGVWRVRPDGLCRGRKLIASETEKDIYEARGLQFIEPELLEGRDEIARAARHKLPKLVSDNDLHGILHCHTTASDGTQTLENMANATITAAGVSFDTSSAFRFWPSTPSALSLSERNL
jgi:hypothetical protein